MIYTNDDAVLAAGLSPTAADTSCSSSSASDSLLDSTSTESLGSAGAGGRVPHSGLDPHSAPFPGGGGGPGGLPGGQGETYFNPNTSSTNSASSSSTGSSGYNHQPPPPPHHHATSLNGHLNSHVNGHLTHGPPHHTQTLLQAAHQQADDQQFHIVPSDFTPHPPNGGVLNSKAVPFYPGNYPPPYSFYPPDPPHQKMMCSYSIFIDQGFDTTQCNLQAIQGIQGIQGNFHNFIYLQYANIYVTICI